MVKTRMTYDRHVEKCLSFCCCCDTCFLDGTQETVKMGKREDDMQEWSPARNKPTTRQVHVVYPSLPNHQQLPKMLVLILTLKFYPVNT